MYKVSDLDTFGERQLWFLLTALIKEFLFHSRKNGKALVHYVILSLFKAAGPTTSDNGNSLKLKN